MVAAGKKLDSLYELHVIETCERYNTQPVSLKKKKKKEKQINLPLSTSTCLCAPGILIGNVVCVLCPLSYAPV